MYSKYLSFFSPCPYCYEFLVLESFVFKGVIIITSACDGLPSLGPLFPFFLLFLCFSMPKCLVMQVTKERRWKHLKNIGEYGFHLGTSMVFFLKFCFQVVVSLLPFSFPFFVLFVCVQYWKLWFKFEFAMKKF